MKELDNLLKLTEEIKQENEKERKYRKTRMVFSWILLVIGMYMLWYYTSWHVALAVFLLLWSNNIAVRLRNS